MRLLKDSRAGKVVLRPTNLWEVPFVNMGLLLGFTRAGGSFGKKDLGALTYASRLDDLLDTCPAFIRTAIHRRFFVENRKELESTRLPWFMPEWLGGLGLRPIPGEFENSLLDRRIATRIVRNWKKERPVRLDQKQQPWMIRKLTSELLPQTMNVREESRSIRAVERLNGLLAFDLLFRSEITLEMMYTEQGEVRNASWAINRNARLWKPTKGDYRSVPIPDAVLNTPRHEGLRVRDTATGKERFPSQRLAFTTKELVQMQSRIPIYGGVLD